MAQRKHTHCASCARIGHFRYLEVYWRFNGVGPFWWVGGWICASCAVAVLDNINRFAGAVLRID